MNTGTSLSYEKLEFYISRQFSHLNLKKKTDYEQVAF